MIGVPADEAGEIPGVRRKAGATDTDARHGVRRRRRSRPTSALRRSTFVDAIPKSPSGKILRRLLRDSNKASTEPEHASQEKGTT